MVGRRGMRVILAILAGVFALVVGASPAFAEDTGLKGTIRDPGTEAGIAGVVINVEGNGFTGTATSDAEGKWTVIVPGAGDYTVSLDITTLPAGLALADAGKASSTVKVFDGKVKTQLFKLSAGGGGDGGDGAVVAPEDQRASKWSQLPQLTVDGLLFGIVIALSAVGLSLIYGTTKLTNFAQGELTTLGGLLAFFFSGVVGLPFILAAIVGVLASALIGGWAQNRFLWKPLRRRGTGLIAAMVVSIGFGLLVRYFYLFIFGGQTRNFPEYAGQAGIAIGPILITPKDLIAAIVGALLIAGTTVWLLKSKAGKATRAVADNPALASASGIEVERVISSVWILGAGLAGFSGIMLGLQAGISWQTGFMVLLLVFAGAVLGGLGTAFGAIVGSLIVGVLVQVSTLFIPTELKYVGALVILILILLVRPQGLLGKSERIG